MAYNPVSGFTLQVIAQSGEVASDYYLKFYEANTTTPLSMATDSTGGTLLVKAKLSDSGFPISNPLDNSTVFIPHMNANYRLVVYLNETDADANDTASAYVNIPNVSTMVGASAIGTVAALDTGTAAGEVPTNADLPTVLASYIGRKNLIINGDFSVWQRGTSQTATGYGSDDRFSNIVNGSTQVASQQTFTLGQTDVPNNPKFHARTVVTSVAGAGNFAAKRHRIEDVTKTAGQTVTLSFRAKADAAKDIAVEFSQQFGSGGSPSAATTAIGVTTKSLTADWVRQVVTVELPSISGKTLGTDGNDNLDILIWFDAGSNFNARTNSLGQQSGTFDIANVQLEFGDTATEFEYVDPADQLARCQRYFERISAESTFTPWSSGQVQNTTTTGSFLAYTRKRAIPSSISVSNPTHLRCDTAASSANATAFTTSNKSSISAVATTTFSGLTAGQGALLLFNTTSGFIDIDAEL